MGGPWQVRQPVVNWPIDSNVTHVRKWPDLDPKRPDLGSQLIKIAKNVKELKDGEKLVKNRNTGAR